MSLRDFSWCGLWLFILSVAACGLGCAEVPRKPATRALFNDLRKAEQLSEDSGWEIDRIQVEENLELSLRSVCRADEATRQDLADFLQRRIERLGGPAREQFARNGGDIDELADVLTLERTAMFLQRAREQASQDCPFYVQPDPDFAGIEDDQDRLVMWAESQGFGALLFERGRAAISGGGSLRAILGHHLSPHLALGMGGEFGGSGTLMSEEGSDQLDTVISAAVPVVLRLTDLSRVFDLEVTPVFRFNAGERAWPPGIRATVAGGLAAMRSGDFMPYLLLYAGAEYHFAQEGVPGSTSLRIGTRVGVDFDP